MGIGCGYMGICGALAFGANAGFNALAARCHGIKDNLQLNFFVKKQAKLISFFSFLMIIFSGIVTFLFGFTYAHNPKLLYWSRVFMVVICFGMILIIFMDMVRNFFLGCGLIVETIIAELSNIVFILVFAPTLCFTMDFGFSG